MVQTHRYQRILRKVLVDGQDANLEQIRAGLAWHYKQYGKDQQPIDRRLYAEAQEAASINGVGLWRDPSPIPPLGFSTQVKGLNVSCRSCSVDYHFVF